MENLRRNTQAIINNFVPVTQSRNELVEENFESGKFPSTKTAIIKLLAMVVLLAGFSLFLAQSKCANTSDWYPFLFPISLGISIFIQLTFFVIFSLGFAVKNTGQWEILINLLSAILTEISSFLTNFECSNSTEIHKIPGPLGIAGGVLLIIGCCAMFLLYRYKEDEQEIVEENSQQGRENGNNKKPNEPPRKSVFV